MRSERQATGRHQGPCCGSAESRGWVTTRKLDAILADAQAAPPVTTDRGPRAPRVFWTHRGGTRWAATHNPWLPHTPENLAWLITFWRDQADRGIRRAELLAALAVACAVVSAVAGVLRVLQ